MSAKNSTLPDGLHDVLHKAYNVLIGSASSSFLALASAIALKRIGLSTEQLLYARRSGFEKTLPDAEVELAVNILHSRFSSLSNEKFGQILNILDLPEQTSFSDKEWGAAFDVSLARLKPVFGTSAIQPQPKDLALLVTSIYSIEEGATVYSPFSRSCCIVPYLPESVNFIAQEIQDEDWAIGKLRLAAYGLINTVQLSKQDPVLEHDSGIHDYVFSFPPFEYTHVSFKKLYSTEGSVHAALLERCLPALDNGNKVVMVVPYWFLLSDDNFELRKHLVKNDLIESVIYLSGRVYAEVCYYNIAILCLNKLKKEKNKIFFFDANDLISESVSQKPVIDVETVLKVQQQKIETEEAKFVSAGMVQKRDYHLHPRWHLMDIMHGLKESDNLVTLGSIATLIYGKREADATTVADRILIKDLCEDASDFELRQHSSNKAASRGEYLTIVDEPCLLVSLGWVKLKPTWYTPNGNRPICFGNEICALKMDTTKVDIAYLLSELYSPLGQYQYNMWKGGNALMRETDLLRMEIRLPTLEEQKSKVK